MKLAVVAVALLWLCGCSSTETTAGPSTVTTTVTVSTASPASPPQTAAPTQTSGAAARSYSGNGVWAVGRPRDGVQRFIPPGLYLVKLAPGSPGGSWRRCSSILCGLPFPDTRLATSNILEVDYVEVMEVEPSDVAVHLNDVVLTPVSE